MSTTPTGAMAERLHQAADLLAAHPDLPAPYVTSSATGRVALNWYLHGRDLDEKATARRIVTGIDGTWDKTEGNWAGPLLEFSQQRGPLDLFVTVARDQVCERVVVGTETVTIPATEAVEAQPERVEERELVEWRCAPILAETPVEQVSA